MLPAEGRDFLHELKIKTILLLALKGHISDGVYHPLTRLPFTDKTGRNLTESERHIVKDAYGHLALEISLEGASHPLTNASAEEYLQEVMERFNKKTEE